MMANGKQPTASRALVIFVRWRVERTPNQPQLLVSQTSCSLFTYCLAKAVWITASLFCFRFPLWHWIFVVRRLLLSVRDWVVEKLAGCRGSLYQWAGSPGQLPLTGRTEFPSWWAAKKALWFMQLSRNKSSRNSMNIVNINILFGI